MGNRFTRFAQKEGMPNNNVGSTLEDKVATSGSAPGVVGLANTMENPSRIIPKGKACPAMMLLVF
jgi:hypothetical protein